VTATPLRTAPRASRDALLVALQRFLSRDGEDARRIVGLERRPSPYRSSFPLEELDLTLDDGSETALVFKDLGPATISPAARAARTSDVHDPLREIEAYRRVLGPAGLSTSAYIGAVTEPATERYWLFLERVPGVGLDQVGSLRTWSAAAAWLGRMHGHFIEEPDRLHGVERLLRYDARRFAAWARRAVDVAQRSLPRDQARAVEWSAVRFLGTIERLAAMPATFAHGDCYASNVLVVEGVEPARVCPVDWELAGVGPPLLDLAALVAGDWAEDARSTMVEVYRDAFQPCSGIDGQEHRPGRSASIDPFLEDLDRCSLSLAMRCLTRPPGYPAPPQHARNWVAEAVRLAERLEP
jgi:hypothetical protein